MATMPQLRKKISLSAGNKNKALRDILTPTGIGSYVESVETVIGQLHNTKAVIMVDQWVNGAQSSLNSDRFIKRSILYNRVDINTMVPETVGVPRGDINTIIKTLNTKYQCDFTEDDLELVNNNLVAKPNSLGYYGIIESAGVDHVYLSVDDVERIVINDVEWLVSEDPLGRMGETYLKDMGLLLIDSQDSLGCFRLKRLQNTTSETFNVVLHGVADSIMGSFEVLTPQLNQTVVAEEDARDEWVLTEAFKKVSFTVGPNTTFNEQELLHLKDSHLVGSDSIIILALHDRGTVDCTFSFYVNDSLILSSKADTDELLNTISETLNAYFTSEGYLIDTLVVMTEPRDISFEYNAGLKAPVIVRIEATYNGYPATYMDSVFSNRVWEVKDNVKVVSFILYDPIDVNF